MAKPISDIFSAPKVPRYSAPRYFTIFGPVGPKIGAEGADSENFGQVFEKKD